MTYTAHSLVQGTKEWDDYRSGSNNASDSAAALNISPYKTRSALIREMATGETKGIDAATARCFSDGHRFEALARPIAEQIVGGDLFPATVSMDVPGLKRRLSASLDGLLIDDSATFEHKSLNNGLAASLDAGIIPDQYHPQMEQGLMITGATRCLFMASKWDANDQLIEEHHAWYESNPSLRERIIAAWKQVEADLAAYQPVEVAAEVVAAPINDLPALSIEITGNVVASNLAQWRGIVTERIAAINTDLQTDQQFADADKMVKFLADGEDRIKIVKSQAQAQAVSIDEVFRALDDISATMRTKRLELDKLVKARKENIRGEVANEGRQAYAEHCAALNARLNGQYLPGNITAQFAEVMKGRKTVSSLRDAVSTELARVKIESNALADKVDANLKRYGELAAGYEFLFRDLFSLALQPTEAFDAMVQQRIGQHEEQQRKKDAEAKAKADAAIAEEERLLVLARQQQTDQATVSKNGASSTPEFPTALSPAEAVAQDPAPSAAPTATVAASVTAPAPSAAGEIEHASLVSELRGSLLDLSFAELQQVANFVERLKIARQRAA